jgi:hypothetical protein
LIRSFAACARSSSGQATVEWIALIAMVSTALGALAWLLGLRQPEMALAHAIGERIVCAVRLTEDCREEPALRAANGAEVAALLRDHAPALLYEEGMTALPVDFRACRSDACAEGSESGPVIRSQQGLRTVAFTHVVDCRAGHVVRTEVWGGNCSGGRAGNLYLQYWLYYPGSATAEGSTPLKRTIRRVSRLLGHPSYHPDDWEGYQVRIGPGGSSARATAHHRYSYELDRPLLPYTLRRDRGRWRLEGVPTPVNGWGPEGDAYYISGGSHAGTARIRGSVSRTTKDGRLVLIPLETIPGRDSYSFAVSPPWRKRVYFDPEYAGTD